MVAKGLVGIFLAAGMASLLCAQSLAPVFISVHNEAGVPVQGAVVHAERDGRPVARVVSGADGKAEIPGLPAGDYKISITQDGFEQSVQSIAIRDERQEVDIEVALLAKLRRTDSIDVVADAGDIDVQAATPAAAELHSAEVETLPSRPSTVADTLPLVPGVNRGSNGEIQISGQAEQQSALIVNSTNVTDPATGGFGTTVPMDSVESINVLKTPFLPQYGGFTAGVVSVDTKRGGDRWRFGLREPFPDFRIRSGHMRGLRDVTPRVSFSGPVMPNKLFMSESGQYMLEKKQVRTLSFPNNESKGESVNSFTQVDYIISPVHFFTASVHLAPNHVNFVDPEFFNPQPVTPSLRSTEHAFTFSDHVTMRGGLLDSSIAQQGFDARIGAQGDADMVLTPTGNRGNYYARRTRQVSRSEWLETLSINKGSAHALKFGTVAARVAGSGSFSFKPVEVLDSNGNMLERIDFAGGSPFEKTDMEGALFAQDHWALTPRISLDGGGRLEYQARTASLRTAPRIAIAWTPFREGKFIIRGGLGVFYDRVPLGVFSFGHYPQRILTIYDPSGAAAPETHYFGNTMDVDGQHYSLVRRGAGRGNFAPHSQTWTVEVERTLTRNLHVRLNYQHSNSDDGILLTPRTLSGSSVYALGGGGLSTYRQFEATARFTWKGGQQMMFSYVRSKAQGDLNTFNTFLGDYPSAPIRPNYFSNLHGDLPNRFVAWGVINMPWKARLSPVFEYRSGVPYAVVEARWNYVGTPYTDKMRFRSYAGLDERLSRDFAVTSKYKARISASVMNTFNHFNPLDVHANVADPLYGTFFGHYKRRYRADFEILF